MIHRHPAYLSIQTLLRCRQFLVGFALLVALLHGHAGATDLSRFDEVRERLRIDYMGKVNSSNVSHLIAKQSPQGMWPDIDYSEGKDSEWGGLTHWDRLLAISAGYNQRRSEIYRSKPAAAAVEKGLRGWLSVKPLSRNWWFNDVGVQIRLVPILALMWEELPEDIRKSCVELLNAPGEVPKSRATGQNLMWFATQQLARGVFRRNSGDMEAASRAIASLGEFSAGEGLQPDFSFHQHGPQLYSGSYGLAWLQDSARLGQLLHGTPWALNPASIDALSGFALMGLRPLVRGAWLDWGARGREFTRDEKLGIERRLSPTLTQLASLDSDNRGELLKFTMDMKTGRAGWLGNRHYWRSDFMVQQTESGYASVKMVSSRTVGTESGNGENLLGFWLPFGSTFFVRSGEEYNGLPELWNWARIPGVTAPDDVPALKGYQRHNPKFVGGVSDGKGGAAAMVLEKEGISGRKSWFFDSDMVVALGEGLQSQRKAPLHTTINQTRLLGPIKTSAGISSSSRNTFTVPKLGWLWSDGIGYFFLGGPAQVNTSVVSSRGRRANELLGAKNVSAEVLTVLLEHEKYPASYAYAVWLGASSPDRMQKARLPKVIGNTSKVQAVEFNNPSETVQAVFFEAGSLKFQSGTLEVSAPCLLLLSRSGREWGLTVSEPTGQVRVINVSIKSAGVHWEANVSLPAAWEERGRGKKADLRRVH